MPAGDSTLIDGRLGCDPGGWRLEESGCGGRVAEERLQLLAESVVASAHLAHEGATGLGGTLECGVVQLRETIP
jgi:hypothetical protein